MIIFLGFNKTATTAIHKLFALNSFPSVHWDAGRLAHTMLSNAISDQKIFHGYDNDYRIFSDLLWRNRTFWFEGNSLFRQIHAHYPEARFIYQYRPMEAWIESRLNHPGTVADMTFLEFHLKHLGTTKVQDVTDHWRRTRERLELDLQAFFHNKSSLLEIDINDEKFVERIAGFTGLDLDPRHWGRHNVTR